MSDRMNSLFAIQTIAAHCIIIPHSLCNIEHTHTDIHNNVLYKLVLRIPI